MFGKRGGSDGGSERGGFGNETRSEPRAAPSPPSQQQSAPDAVMPAAAPQSFAPKPQAAPSFRSAPSQELTPTTPLDVGTQNMPRINVTGTADRSESYYDIKTSIFSALLDTIDLSQLAKLDQATAREEIRDIVSEIISIKNVMMSIAEQEELLNDICNDVLGYGPLEPLLARDDIADIMVNGANNTFIEVSGKIHLTNVRFRDNSQLLNICQRIVSQVGRRVDESSPICDARLIDGSRVNVIVPPLSLDGPTLTIRKFKKDKLTLDQLVKYGTITPEGAEILKIIGRVRCNTVISGGTGSGKTTLLNCLTKYVDFDERIITCEDAAELQLQQPHVVRLETRPANIEGEGAVTMRDLVKNCLRMRPERII
ncbi:MAG: ATPase, T2SS/T4P/T4SS family, partial [Pseudomonadota bacterium]